MDQEEAGDGHGDAGQIIEPTVANKVSNRNDNGIAIDMNLNGADVNDLTVPPVDKSKIANL